MSLIINTNFAATVASNNLAAANMQLQKSLNRLSSGSKIVSPADDAGGLAVSMKLSAAAKRQGAVMNNIGNSVSYLQTQDGALKVASKVLDRVSELKTLAADPTKNSSDIANYNAEFTELKAQLAAVGAERFNGVALFNLSTLDVPTREDGGEVIDIGGINLFGISSSWTNVGMNPADWTASDPDIGPAPASTTKNIVSAGDPTIEFHSNGPGTYTTNQSIEGGFTLSFDTTSSVPDAYSAMTISAGGNTLNLTALLPDSTDHHVEIVDDGVTASISINGGAATVMGSLIGGGGGPLVFSTGGTSGFATDFHLANLSLANTSGGSNYTDVTNAASLSALNLSTVTGAIQDLATHRATNGAQQSRLGFASELLTTNKANLEAATSRIVDVDVAAESSQLARYNVLVQAGTSMLGQANQSPQSILRLLG